MPVSSLIPVQTRGRFDACTATMMFCLSHCLLKILLFLKPLRPPPKPVGAAPRRFRHRLFGWLTTASLLILLVSQLLGNAPFAGATAVFAATKPKALPAHLTYQQFQQLSRQATAQHKPFQWYQPTTPSPMSKQEQASLNTPLQLPPSAEPPTMQPIKQALSAAFLAGAPQRRRKRSTPSVWKNTAMTVLAIRPPVRIITPLSAISSAKRKPAAHRPIPISS